MPLLLRQGNNHTLKVLSVNDEMLIQWAAVEHEVIFGLVWFSLSI